MKKTLCHICLFVLLLGCMACSRTPSPSFYLLTSAENVKAAETPRVPNLRIGLLPVQVAGYLDKQQMITRSNANTLNLDDFHLWGEPLKDNMRRVLQENLSRLRPTDAVFYFPDTKQESSTLQIALRLTQCECDSNGQAALSATWEVYSNEKKQVITTRSVSLASRPLNHSHAALAAALSRLTGELSQAVSKSLDEKI